MRYFKNVRIAFFTIIGALFLTNAPAYATIFDFETPSTDLYKAIGPVYGGLIFTNWLIISGPPYSDSGYATVITSGVQSACGCASDYGQPFTSISSGSTFSLVSGNFASAWNNGATMLVEGYLGSLLLYSQSFLLDVTGPSPLHFGFSGIDLVNFSISGRTWAGQSGSGDYFAVDDLRIDAAGAVPEPATWGMMLAGFGIIGLAARRRSSIKTAVTYA